MADVGPSLVLSAIGLILWLAVDVTLAGISVQTIGLILFLAGVAWLIIELMQSRRVRGPRETVVREEPVRRQREPVVREREMY
jgi:hypothetical protein